MATQRILVVMVQMDVGCKPGTISKEWSTMRLANGTLMRPGIATQVENARVGIAEVEERPCLVRVRQMLFDALQRTQPARLQVEAA